MSLVCGLTIVYVLSVCTYYIDSLLGKDYYRFYSSILTSPDVEEVDDDNDVIKVDSV